MKASLLPRVIAVVVVVFVGCAPERNVSKNVEPPNQFDRIAQVVKSEELILALTPRLKKLVSTLAQSEAAEADCAELPAISYEGLADLDLLSELQLGKSALVTHHRWPLADEPQRGVGAHRIWQRLREYLQFEDTQVGTLNGRFVDRDTFVMETKFEGRCRLKSDSNVVFGIKGKQSLEWQRSEVHRWELSAWKQKRLELISAVEPLFAEVTEEAIPDLATRENLIRSVHQEYLISRLDANSKEAPVAEYGEFVDWECGTQFPSVSVVDYNRDGWDDLLVLDRWDDVVLLRNQQDGTFEDVTAEAGLSITGYANCAAFFDIDNDGDADLFVGRTTKPSQLYRNENGRFVLEPELNRVLEDSRFVIAASVVDINRDGLSDLYLSTYAFGTGDPRNWVTKMFPERVQQRMLASMIGKNMYLDRGGPANIVLVNQGDRFVEADLPDNVRMWRNSFQSGWSDFDGDGDSDVYVCNDFAPDVILRNDTPRGSGQIQFVDVTDEIMPNNMAFGMGVSWGDYNNNGRMDLFVSNMYSKAGIRIVPQLGETDKRILRSAKGNFLYEHDGKRFVQVAGHDQGQQRVDQVGWSYGGQFADFDNDGYLDLYVPSGYFSVPAAQSTDKDL